MFLYLISFPQKPQTVASVINKPVFLSLRKPPNCHALLLFFENIIENIEILKILLKIYFQATSTPAERVISRLGLVLTKRRLGMKGPLFSKIMYLSDTV